MFESNYDIVKFSFSYSFDDRRRRPSRRTYASVKPASPPSKAPNVSGRVARHQNRAEGFASTMHFFADRAFRWSVERALEEPEHEARVRSDDSKGQGTLFTVNYFVAIHPDAAGYRQKRFLGVHYAASGRDMDELIRTIERANEEHGTIYPAPPNKNFAFKTDYVFIQPTVTWRDLSFEPLSDGATNLRMIDHPLIDALRGEGVNFDRCDVEEDFRPSYFDRTRF